MCAICNTVPICPILGGCSIQSLDYLKMVAMGGGAGFGVMLTMIKSPLAQKNTTNKQHERSSK